MKSTDPMVQAAGGVARVNGELAVSRGFGDAEFKKTGLISTVRDNISFC